MASSSSLESRRDQLITWIRESDSPAFRDELKCITDEIFLLKIEETPEAQRYRETRPGNPFDLVCAGAVFLTIMTIAFGYGNPSTHGAFTSTEQLVSLFFAFWAFWALALSPLLCMFSREHVTPTVREQAERDFERRKRTMRAALEEENRVRIAAP